MKFCLIDAEVFIDRPELLDPLRSLGAVEMYAGIPQDADEVERRAFDADVIAFGLMQFTNEMLDRLPNLKILQFIGTGVWNFVDVDYARSKGIKVLNIEGYGSNAVAEFAVSMALAMAKKIPQAGNVLKTGGWSIDGLMGMEISGSTVGVLGTGSIGRLVAEKFVNMGAKVIANDIYENESLKKDWGVTYVGLEELFRSSDIVTVHMKVTKENEKLIDGRLFGLMKPHALFVNVARAELVNNRDLFEALKEGRMGGAAIDVYENEPPADSDYELARLDNVIATPHMAYYTQEANDNSIKMMVQSIADAL